MGRQFGCSQDVQKKLGRVFNHHRIWLSFVAEKGGYALGDVFPVRSGQTVANPKRIRFGMVIYL